MPRLFDEFAEMMRKCGPVTMIPQKTRVVFQVRVRFGGCYARKSHLQCALALPRVDEDPRFFKIEKYGAHFILAGVLMLTLRRTRLATSPAQESQEAAR